MLLMCLQLGPSPWYCSGRPNQATRRAVNQYSINYLIIKRVRILLLMPAEGFSVKFTHALSLRIHSLPPIITLSPAFYLPLLLFSFFLTLQECLSSL